MPTEDSQRAKQEDGKAELVIDIDEDYRIRVKLSGAPEEVAKLARAIDVPNFVGELMDDRERRAYRKRFFSMAHRTVSVITVLAVAGMVADFLNIWELNTRWVVGLGVWTVGSVSYLYFAIVKDIFRLKEQVPPPPR